MATILALTGDELSLASLQDILETFGHRVVPARDPATALAVLEGERVDLFLIDVLDEAFDLPTLTRTAAARQPRSRILACTAYPRAARSLEALEAGAHGLMRKPFEIGKILEMLGEGRP